MSKHTPKTSLQWTASQRVQDGMNAPWPYRNAHMRAAGEESQQEYISRLIERETHFETMRPLTPLEQQHLEDWRAHFEPLARESTAKVEGR